MQRIRLYVYDKCSTCRQALQFLTAKGLPFDSLPIVEKPPSKSELQKMLGYLKGDLRRLFNTSGQQYRELDMATKLPQLSDDAALDLLSRNGKLIKRPFVLFGSGGLVGFKEDEWKQTFKAF